MKKIFFFAAIAALALSSCSSDELVQVEQPVEDGAVNFGAYVGRDTRAITDKTNITDTELKSDGFGVFAYDQGQSQLKSYLAGNTYPNFFYNQKVADTDNDGTWTYEPLKYWPNHGGYVTYQAYAPHKKDITPIFNVAYNGVGIRYSNNENYDLLWGASAEAADSKCFENQQKPDIENKTTFHFKHALAKLDFTVSYFTDEVHGGTETGLASGTTDLDANTTIVIRSINLVGNLPTTGVLSLYDGSWTIEKADANIGLTTTDLVKGCTSPSATPSWTDLTDGAQGTLSKTNKAVKPASSMMIIPSTTPSNKVHIEITYDVITKDNNDDRNSSTITHVIKSNAIPATGYPNSHTAFEGISIAPGKHTTVNIHLGLTSAKFSASVVGWDESESTNIDMPNNFPAGFTAVDVTELETSTSTTGALYLDGTTIKKWDGTSGTASEDLDGKVILVGGTYYTVSGSAASSMTDQPKTLFIKAGGFYSDSACTTPETPTSGNYYIIGGKLYKKA